MGRGLKMANTTGAGMHLPEVFNKLQIFNYVEVEYSREELERLEEIKRKKRERKCRKRAH